VRANYTTIVTNCKKESLSWVAKRKKSSQEIPYNLRNSWVHYHINLCVSSDRRIQSHSLRSILIIFSHLRLGLRNELLHLGLSMNPRMHFSSPHTSHIHYPFHPPWFDNVNSIWRVSVPITKLLDEQYHNNCSHNNSNNIISILCTSTIKNTPFGKSQKTIWEWKWLGHDSFSSPLCCCFIR